MFQEPQFLCYGRHGNCTCRLNPELARRVAQLASEHKPAVSAGGGQVAAK